MAKNLITTYRPCKGWVVRFIFMSCLVLSSLVKAETILVLRGSVDTFDTVVTGLADGLEEEFYLNEYIVTNKTKLVDIKSIFKKMNPQIVMLLGNKSLNLYYKYQQESEVKEFPPCISVAALFVDKFIEELNNCTAIRYEIPAVTSARVLREVLTKPVKNIGVIYRPLMAELVDENERLLSVEGIRFVRVEIKDKDTQKPIKAALKEFEKRNVDAIWILNDNALLTKSALIKSWLPSRRKSSIPSVVGVKQFVDKIPLGSFAIVPDNYGLGAQAAEIVFEIVDNDMNIEEVHYVHQPISVKKFISLKSLAKLNVDYRENKLEIFDEVFE